MTTLRSIAVAMYADNLRQINLADRQRHDGHLARTGERPHRWNGTEWAPADFVEMTQRPFDEAEPHVRLIYLSYADAALEEMGVNLSDDALDAAIPEHPWYTERETVRSMVKALIKAIRYGK